MDWIDLPLPTPAENLACDEVLLDACDAGGAEVLRFWEPQQYFVVLGYANETAREVNQGWCFENHIPILRRCSGGGTVLQGPGCLNYTVVLRTERDAAFQGISATNEYVMRHNQLALASLLGSPVQKLGHTDLAVGGLKVSGNAQRRKRQSLLFHGSFLLNFDIGMIEKALPMPSKQPDYRVGRSHTDFLMNLKVGSDELKSALCKAWEVGAPANTVPMEAIGRLVSERYGRDEWNFKF
jgi:lipoate---protein ligase